MSVAPGSRPLAFAWTALVIWAIASVAAAAGASAFAPLVGVALLALVLLHAFAGYGWRGTLLLVAIAFVVALVLENLSIATGVPFGFFMHTDHFGARIGQVPAAVAFGYFLYGYPAWMLARLVTGGERPALLVPVVAAFIVTQFDLAHDPIGATVQGLWHYRHPSGFNGVPLSNFLGWLITTGAIFTGWTFVERRFGRHRPATDVGFWAVPVLFWLVTATQYPLMYAALPADTPRRVLDVHESAAIVALVVIGLVVALAASRLIEAHRTTIPPR